jgi:AraC-like DNA-binding protein
MSPGGPATVAATYRGREGMAAFVPAVGAALVAQRLQVPAPAHFAARLTALPGMNGANLVRVSVPALTAERTVGDSAGGGSLFLMHPERAWGVLEHGGGRIDIRPGMCLVIPSSAPFAVSYRSSAVLTFCELPAAVASRRYGLADGPVTAFDVHPVARELLRSVSSLEAAARRHLAGPAAVPHDDVVRVTSVLIDALVNGRGTPDTLSLHAAALGVLEGSAADPDLSAAAVAARLGVSVRTLHRAFQGGPTLLEELTRLRLERAAGMLASHPERSVSEVAHACGFGSHSRFAALFREHHGAVPSAWRKSVIASAESA